MTEVELPDTGLGECFRRSAPVQLQSGLPNPLLPGRDGGCRFALRWRRG